MGVSLPTGTVTFVFTDIEGSTRRVQELGSEQWQTVLFQHYELLRRAWADNNGVEMGTEGDAFFVVFAQAADAVKAALQGQLALADHPWDGEPIRVRIGMHTGEATVVGDDYIGLAVHEAARVGASAHGGQVIVSDATRQAVGDDLPSGASWRDLGRHALKDIAGARSLHQLDHPKLMATFPPPRTLSAIEHNVPTPPTSLVGRTDELNTITSLLLGDTRLVTLTGPGGIGKTRLATEVAYQLLAYQPGGVWFVPLAAVRETEGLLPAIAAILGVREQAGVNGLAEALTRRLRGAKTLLVLDNLEQVVEGVSVIAELMGDLPDLRVLATSRERLRLRGERVVVVPPLGVGDENESTSEASHLFEERAESVGEPVGAGDEAAVQRIVTALGGVPLAIELAVARLPDVGIAGLESAMSSLLDVLTEGERDLPLRQQTLRAALTWSHDLLSPADQRVFARASVFAGSIPSEAIDDVCGPDGRESVSVLIAKSLIQADRDRLSMLEPIRQLAAEHLDASDERVPVRLEHAQWFRDLAERADPELVGPRQAEWIRRLGDQHDNFVAGLEYGAGRPDIELRVAAALARYWYVRGHWTEGRSALHRALAVGGDAVVRSAAGVGAAALAIAQGDVDAASNLLPSARAAAEEAGDSTALAKVLNAQAEVARLRGDNSLAADLLSEARALAGRDPIVDASIMINIGLVALADGDLIAAAEAMDDAIVLHSERGNARGAALAMLNRGRIGHLAGDFSQAEERYSAALTTLTELGEQAGAAAALENLAVLLEERREFDRIPSLLGQLLHLRRRLGDDAGESRALAQLGNLHANLHNFDEAVSWFDSAGIVADRRCDTALLVSIESMRAHCLSELGRFVEAIGAAEAASQHHLDLGSPEEAEQMRLYADGLREKAAGADAPAASS